MFACIILGILVVGTWFVLALIGEFTRQHQPNTYGEHIEERHEPHEASDLPED